MYFKYSKIGHRCFTLCFEMSVCLLDSTAFISTLTGIDYFNNNTDYISRVTFFLNDSVPEDLIPDTWNKVVDFYLGSDRVVTTTNVHNIINVSVM
jgi:hypothetical protein